MSIKKPFSISCSSLYWFTPDLSPTFFLWIAIIISLTLSLKTDAATSAPSSDASQKLKPNEFIRNWLILGPVPLGDQKTPKPGLTQQKQAFAADALALQGGETHAHPGVGLAIDLPEKKLSWKVVRSAGDTVDLMSVLGENEACAAYAWTEITVANSTKTVLGIGSDDAVKVWLNGQVVLDKWVQRGVNKDDDLVKVELKKGRNPLLIKVQNGNGAWGFACRFLNPQGMIEPLVSAALSQDRNRVSLFVTNGADINGKVGPGLAAWQAAKIRGRDDIARFLVENGARTNMAFPKPDQLVQWYITNRVRPDEPGLSLAVVRNGKVDFKGGWGVASLDYGVPIRPNTVFHVASVSKQFTAFAAALLERDGKLSLDDDARKYLPNLPDFGKKVTLMHLLNHTSGIRDQWELLMMAGWRLDDVITQKDILTMLEHQKELNFPPGEEHLYCNSGFTLLAETVAKVAGQSFCDFTQERMFKPLGMTNTHFHLDHEMIVKNMAYSYYPSGSGFKKSVLSYANVGATSLFTTVEDLSRWLANFEDPKIGGAGVLQRMQQKGKLNNGKEINYALGLGIEQYRKTKMVAHGGADAGYRSMLMWFPEQHLGIALLSNLGSIGGDIPDTVADFYLRDQLAPAATSDAAKPKAAPATEESAKATPKDLEIYTGKYQLEGNVVGTVVKDGDHLKFEVMGQSNELKPIGEHEFSSSDGAAIFKFENIESGKAGQMALKTGAQNLTFKRLEGDAAPQTNLAEFQGSYYSPELGVSYLLALKEGKLVAIHRRHGEFSLESVVKDDFSVRFMDGFPMRIKFARDEVGNVSGLRLTGQRVRNLAFDRIKN